MHKPSIPTLLHRTLFPHPRPTDPPTLPAHISRNLVPEVRLETANFYGALDCVEAQYPGLDYTYGPHRKRLSRFPWHRKLFRAFDSLGLTDGEILSICCWEGTRSAKERYERDVGRMIRDTTCEGVAGPEPRQRPAAYFHTDKIAQEELRGRKRLIQGGALFSDEEEDMENTEPDDVVEASVGISLNERLRAAADAGEIVYDQQFEQWMKDALESHEMDLDAMLHTLRAGHFPHQEERRDAEMDEGEDTMQHPSDLLNNLLASATELQGVVDNAVAASDQASADLERRINGTNDRVRRLTAEARLATGEA